jgi:hypothetical protein
MEILEDKERWSKEFRDGWLKLQQETGEINWNIYRNPRNSQTPAASGVELAESRLLFITSSGAYLRGKQQPFDAPNPLGDYTLRTFAASTSFSDLAYAHDHYDHAMIDADPQVAIPLEHLKSLVEAGKLGEISPTIVSFMGYQPDSARVVDEMIPSLMKLAEQEEPDAALLAPV